ncbi:uncharacterized protein LOC116213017 isoform X1 [Punica granatum]|uniref:Uncharacterized protein LOC116213017 isoform X1 n=1 Tax=Punica granatum TaxID=22663 RepID=A0A6P8E8R4_PUNGR|nr:uncharacterized protein LOC116213017 isoform X1 [Punica granatum]
MGGVCSGGKSTIRDAKEGSETKVSRSPGRQRLTNGSDKQKEVSSSLCSDGEASQNALQKHDGSNLSVAVSCRVKSSSTAQNGPSKIAKKSAFSERSRNLSFKQAVKILDTIGKSVSGLSNEFIYGLVSRGNKISILAFEVANTIVKGANLLESLSENNIQSLKDTLRSEGVQRLVSQDMNKLLMIASSDKREEFDVFLREVIRFGDLCKDSHWHNLGRYFSRLQSDDSDLKPLREEAETTIGELSLFARYTSELYHELNILDRFEQDYKQKLEEAKCFNLPHGGEELMMLRDELKHQQKLVKSLKRKSLWSRNIEEIMVKLIGFATYIHQKFMGAFGSNGLITMGSREDAHRSNNTQRLGPTGLALHYANIIIQIDTIASRPACLPHNIRDSLYHALPSSVKTALRSRLKAVSLNERFSISRVKAEMEKTSRWLIPFATNTIKAHQKFGWVGDWANASKDSAKSTSTSNEPICLQTLYHADKEKTDLYILEIVVWLHQLMSLVKERVHSIGPLSIESPSHQRAPKFHPKMQQFPPINYSVQKPDLPKKAEVKLSQEDRNLLEEVCRRRSVPGISKSQSLTVSRKKRRGKVCPLSRSTGSSPSREMGERPVSKHPSIDVLDLIDGLNETLN